MLPGNPAMVRQKKMPPTINTACLTNKNGRIKKQLNKFGRLLE